MTALLGGLGVLGLGLVALVSLEVAPLCAWLAPRIARRAACRLPSKHREIREEEWLAMLATMDGLKVIRMFTACGFYVSTFALLKMPSVRAAQEADRAAAAGVDVRNRFAQSFRLFLLTSVKNAEAGDQIKLSIERSDGSVEEITGDSISLSPGALGEGDKVFLDGQPVKVDPNETFGIQFMSAQQDGQPRRRRRAKRARRPGGIEGC